MTMNGTDISAFQPGSPNLGTNRFGWCKATEGVGWESPVWRQQIAKLRALHDGSGYYHLCNGLNTPQAEAEYFWGVIGGTWQVGEPIAIDAEPEFYARLADPVGWLLACAEELYRLTGLKAVLYSDWDHLKNHGYNFQPLVDYNCGLWGAAYNPNGYGDPSPWPAIFCWQDSDRDESSGGDDDIVYGDLSTWQAYGTPQGADMAITQADADLIAKTTANAVWNYAYKKDDGNPGEPIWVLESLGGIISQAIIAPMVAQVDAHTDAALKALPAGGPLTLTDAQVTTLANLLVAKLPPAQIAALADQLKK